MSYQCQRSLSNCRARAQVSSCRKWLPRLSEKEQEERRASLAADIEAWHRAEKELASMSAAELQLLADV